MLVPDLTKSMQQNLTQGKADCFKYLQLLQRNSILHIELKVTEVVPTKITITNASIYKTEALKRDLNYNIDNRGFRPFITYTIIF